MHGRVVNSYFLSVLFCSGLRAATVRLTKLSTCGQRKTPAGTLHGSLFPRRSCRIDVKCYLECLWSDSSDVTTPSLSIKTFTVPERHHACPPRSCLCQNAINAARQGCCCIRASLTIAVIKTFAVSEQHQLSSNVCSPQTATSAVCQDLRCPRTPLSPSTKIFTVSKHFHRFIKT